MYRARPAAVENEMPTSDACIPPGQSPMTLNANRPALSNARHQRSKIRLGGYNLVVRIDRLCGWCVLGDQRAKPQHGKELEALLAIRSPIVEARHVNDRAAEHLCGSAAEPGSLAQSRHLSASASRYFFCVQRAGVARADRSRDPCAEIKSRAPFSPIPGHPLDVVDGVAHQREHVNHLLRRAHRISLSRPPRRTTRLHPAG